MCWRVRVRRHAIPGKDYYLTEFWNFGYGLRVKVRKIICIFGNVITLKIKEIMACSKLQVS